MTNWRIARLGPPVRTWEILSLTASGVAPPAPPTGQWKVMRMTGSTARDFQWKVMRLTGSSVKQVPNWRVANVQARTVKATDGWIWAYVSGRWRPAVMYIWQNNGWFQLDQDFVP